MEDGSPSHDRNTNVDRHQSVQCKCNVPVKVCRQTARDLCLMMPESDLGFFFCKRGSDVVSSSICRCGDMWLQNGQHQTHLQVSGGTEWKFQDEVKLSHVSDNKQD